MRYGRAKTGHLSAHQSGHRVRPCDKEAKTNRSSGRYGSDLDLEARVDEAGDDEEARGWPCALEDAIADFPKEGHALGVGDEDVAVDEIPGRHSLRLQNAEDIEPGELVLKPLIGGNITVAVDANLARNMQNASAAGNFNGLTVVRGRPGRFPGFDISDHGLSAFWCLKRIGLAVANAQGT